MNPGEATRKRHQLAMQATAVGATVARGTRAWTITQRKDLDGVVSLTLRHGRRTLRASVPVCITGPCWADVGLRPLAAAPSQQTLPGVGAC